MHTYMYVSNTNFWGGEGSRLPIESYSIKLTNQNQQMLVCVAFNQNRISVIHKELNWIEPNFESNRIKPTLTPIETEARAELRN